MKKNSLKKTIIVTSIVTLLPILAGLFWWEQLPDRMATHFGIDNIPNGWSSKGFTVFGIPFVCFICHLLCTAATLTDPKREKINDKIMKLILWITPIVSIVCMATIYGYALNYSFDMERITNLLMGILFVVIGNYMPKCKQNYTVGIKIPWTLDNEENWNRTHRLAGWLWVLTGVFILLNGIFKLVSLVFVLPVIIIVSLIPMIYSFFFYIRHKQ